MRRTYDLVEAFAKRYPNAHKATSEKEILEDKVIQLIVSASIPIDRAPLGIQAMKHGKDFMVDKPGIITLSQLAEARKKLNAFILSCIASALKTKRLLKQGSW